MYYIIIEILQKCSLTVDQNSTFMLEALLFYKSISYAANL